MASPLTLSEVRSMLPAGMLADLCDASLVRAWHRPLPEVQTVAALLHGGCSCDFVLPRPADPKADDADLRKRYRAAAATRSVTIQALERHARARALRKYAPGHWPVALNRFVAEHARNAGATGYLLEYETDGRMVAGSDGGVDAGADDAMPAPIRPSDRGSMRVADREPERLAVPARHDHAWLVPDRVIIVTP
ncbi:MAG TPA: hypothetical protein VGR60_07110 [Gemmatimonadales bacterium]|nr:hypothetical protein [Gemmatimonadales bacterium]